MKKERTIQVKSWKELTKLVESINPYEKTIILTGFINKLTRDRTHINTLFFSTKPVQILGELEDDWKSEKFK